MPTTTPLVSLICDLIVKDGPMTIERYMEIVLHHREHGYYRHGNPLGTHGDFITSPEASPIFGEMIGGWCVEAWKHLGSPSPFILLELGPGQGSLLHAALHYTQHIEGFNQALRLYLLESSSTLRLIQEGKLSNYNPVHIDNLETLPPWPMIVIANEFFDTFPIRQFIRSRIGWHERMVTNSKGGLHFITKHRFRLPKDRLHNYRVQELRPRSVYETSAQTGFFMTTISNHIARHGGAGLIIDYGYVDPPKKGTLDAIYQQGFVDVFHLPGQVDVTAGVDFSVLADIAAKNGNAVVNLSTQHDFLNRLNIMHRAEFLRAHADNKLMANINRGMDYITSHSQMGKFKVLEFGKFP